MRVLQRIDGVDLRLWLAGLRRVNRAPTRRLNQFAREDRATTPIRVVFFLEQCAVGTGLSRLESWLPGAVNRCRILNIRQRFCLWIIRAQLRHLGALRRGRIGHGLGSRRRGVTTAGTTSKANDRNHNGAATSDFQESSAVLVGFTIFRHWCSSGSGKITGTVYRTFDSGKATAKKQPFASAH
jgi:hypothetical protein